MFESVLIANRGEIAVRIAKTLRKMGIRSVVVASIPDRRSLAVRTADAWVLLEGYSAAESYLDVDAVIAAAKAEGCQAIHPGYGFLSERTDFAERCAAEGLTFIGPPPAVLRGLGDKAAARQLAVANGVPVVPGWDGADDPETLVREAGRIGYPVMLKARGGGGGRGMREVVSAEDLPEAIESARREAVAAFGDGGLLLEKLVTNAHHVEVQVLADTRGNVIHLGERDCSVQRRHQKLIEETPSPVVDEALRERLTGYALKLARAINYVNAGTFEFLVVPANSPSPATEGSRERGPGGEGPEVYFLEVNPRLQVEHPVTEMVTGLDLVELQLRIAAGEPLPLKQEDVTFSGHAIEFRINAEDPWDGFKPSSGRIQLGYMDADVIYTGYDYGGIEARAEIPSEYDSLIAKAVFAGPDRRACLEDAESHMVEWIFTGVRTTLPLAIELSCHPQVRSGRADIRWLDANLEQLLAEAKAPPEWWAAAAALAATMPADRWPLAPGGSPFAQPTAAGSRDMTLWLDDGIETKAISVGSTAKAVHVDVDGIRVTSERTRPFTFQFGRRELGGNVSSTWPGMIQIMPAAEKRGRIESADLRQFHLVPPPPLPRRAHTAAEGATAITAPLAGTIAAVRVTEGDAVAEGQLLLVLEAMKMEHRITAPSDGVVKTVHVRERDVVRDGDALVELV